MRPSVDVLKAIGRLQNNQDFLMFTGWLAEESRQATEALHAAADPSRVFREQGSSLVLRDLIKAISVAKPTLG